jgi:hypothetical protein
MSTLVRQMIVAGKVMRLNIDQLFRVPRDHEGGVPNAISAEQFPIATYCISESAGPTIATSRPT